MKSTQSKIKSRCCAIAAILLLSSGLTGCVTASRASADSRRLYQPPVLRLSPGQPVPTLDGVYLPQVAEIWHSDARYRDLESRYLDAVAASAARKP